MPRDTQESAADEIERFLTEHPDVQRIELLFPDMNGVMRGKWLPAEAARKLTGGAVRLPVSTYALDVFGDDVDETGLAQAMGDPDGAAYPVAGSLSTVPWAGEPAAQIVMGLLMPDGAPCPYDPRNRLADVAARFAERGLTPVVATELEFYLHQANRDPSDGPVPPPGLEGSQVYSLDAAARIEPVLREIRDACVVQGIPADTLIAEYGPGQFEINFHHVADPLAAADCAILFKRLVRGCARKHGLAATFMAKPYGDAPGSGMHVHVSALDRNGQNAFAAEDGIADTLRHAVGGALSTMRELQAVFAPHSNSFRRFQPGSYAPVTLSWGLDHRGVAVRLPSTTGAAARLEHRICGADVNPYLALAAILGGLLIGIEEERDPGPMLTSGDGSEGDALHREWIAALDDFEASKAARTIFGDEYVRVYTACRRQETARLAVMITDAEYRTYLHRL